MLGRGYPEENCSIARAREMLGERWSLLIMRDALFRGMSRFSEFQRSLEVATNVLADRLARFVDEDSSTGSTTGHTSQPSRPTP